MGGSEVIAVDDLGKRYRLGSEAASYGRLTESLAGAVGSTVRRFRHGSPPATDSREEVWALRHVSFDVGAGEIVGVVGANGAGKTTLLKLLSRITDPTEGRAELYGRVGSLLEVGTGFHPELSGRENVYLNGAILGMSRAEIKEKFDDIVAFAELEQFIDTPVKRYSSGMYVRLAFAVAAYLETEILFLDEVLSVGDQAFQQRCLGRMGEIAHSGRTIFFVSHNLASVGALCTRALLISGGSLVADGDVDTVLETYISSIQPRSGQTLESRDDRQGDGRLRLTRIDVSSAKGGPPRTGHDCQVSLGYVTELGHGSLTVSLGFEGPLGEPIFLCSNRFTGESVSVVSPGGEVVCRLPALQLLPGRYSIAAHVEVNGVVADWVRSAMFFDVFEDDVFGSGRLPPTTHGRVVVDQAWESVAPR